MWNFLVGGLLTRRVDRPLRRQPRASRPRHALGARRDGGGHVLRDRGELRRGVPEGRRRARAPGATSRALAAVGSTGSPLSPEGFDWVYDHLGPDIWLFSTSGGTDVCTAFVGGVPTLPVYRGELQARALGAKVEAWSPGGTAARRRGRRARAHRADALDAAPLLGRRGRRAATATSYFDIFPGVWRHGDWIEITERGTAIITGRSDATINRGGIRMGTSGDLPRGALARRGRRRARRRPAARRHATA